MIAINRHKNASRHCGSSQSKRTAEAALSSDISDCDLLASSSDRDGAYRVSPSCSGPRRASGLLGVERCDPRLLTELRCRSSGTPDTEDEAPRTSCSLFSILRCSLWKPPTGLLPGASSCVSHSTSVPVPPAHYSRDACTGPLVCMASITPPQEKPRISPRLHLIFFADYTISHIALGHLRTFPAHLQNDRIFRYHHMRQGTVMPSTNRALIGIELIADSGPGIIFQIPVSENQSFIRVIDLGNH